VKIAIHQPEFFPWLGFFDKMSSVDKYVIFDHVQFKKRYFENRNKLKLNGEPVWVTIPVKSRGKQSQRIMDVKINNEENWQKKIFSKIHHCSAGTPHGKEVVKSLEPIFCEKKYDNLLEFNLKIIDWFRDRLSIQTPICFSSNLGVEEYSSSDLILEICKKLKADVYLCGSSGKDYLNTEDFSKDGVHIEWQAFEHPTYNQPGDKFIPFLSSLDFIFNYGDQSANIFNNNFIGVNNEAS